MEFHFPVYQLRPQANKLHDLAQELKRTWIDLSFLDKCGNSSHSPKPYLIYKSHMSFAICGSSEICWVAYAFDDTCLDDEHLDDALATDKGFVEVEDPIAHDGGDGGEVMMADRPIWDPRVYFFVILKFQIDKVYQEWQELVLWIGRRIQDSVDVSERHSRTVASLMTVHTDQSPFHGLNRLLDQQSEGERA